MQYRGKSERLVIITNGGGPGVMAADRATDREIELSTLSAATMTALDEVLPSVWSHGNPVDIIGDAPPKRYQKALDICLKDPGVDGAIVIGIRRMLADGEEVREYLPDKVFSLLKNKIDSNQSPDVHPQE